MIDPKQKPLKEAKEIEDLLDKIRELAKKNIDLITVTEGNGYIRLEDLSHTEFYFQVANSSIDNNTKKISFVVERKPRDDNSIQKVSVSGNKETIINQVKNWIRILRDYESISFSEERKFLMHYENQYYTEFEIIDDNSEDIPFDLKQQLFLNELLVLIEETVNEYEEIDKDVKLELTNSSKEIRASLGKDSKKSVIRSVSKLIAKIRFRSVDLLGKILKKVREELFDRALSHGIDTIQDWISAFLN